MNLLLTASFVLLTSAISTNSFAGPFHGMWWNDPEIKKELHLTDEQVDKINEVFDSYKDEIYKSKENVKDEEKNLKNTIMDPNSMSEDIRIEAHKVIGMKSDLKKLMLEMNLGIRETLNLEQRVDYWKVIRVKLGIRKFRKERRVVRPSQVGRPSVVNETPQISPTQK